VTTNITPMAGARWERVLVLAERIYNVRDASDMKTPGRLGGAWIRPDRVTITVVTEASHTPGVPSSLVETVSHAAISGPVVRRRGRLGRNREVVLFPEEGPAAPQWLLNLAVSEGLIWTAR
jgi:hypothetical protein